MLHSAAALLTFLCCYSPISAFFINIDNPSFEDDGPLTDNTYEYKNVLNTWDLYDPGKLDDSSTGLQNPTGGTAYNDTTFGDSPPDATIAAYVEQLDNKEFGGDEIGIEQTLTSFVTTDTIYTLTAYVGNTDSNTWGSGSTDGGGASDPAGFPGYRVQLLAGDILLAEDNDALSIAEGGWALSTVTVTILSGNNNIGSVLKVRLINKNGSQGGLEVAFDDIQLEATPVLTTQSPTVYPTKYPTLTPTKGPTQQPTLSPSDDPSVSPLIAPTLAPNNEPSADPSASPSDDPSKYPTKRPVFEPSVGPIAETQTQAPNVENIASTQENKGDDDDDDDDKVKEEKGSMNVWVEDYMPLIIGVAGIVSGCFCFCICFVVIKTRKKNKDDGNIGHMEKVQSLEMLSSDDQKECREIPHPPAKKIVAKNDDEKEVQLLFEKELKLPQYYELFIDNGYDSIRAMMAIKDKTELDEIGVTSAGHQSLILSTVKKRKDITDGRMPTNATTTEEAEAAEEDYEKEEIDAQMKRDRQMVKAWFDFNVGLAKYNYHAMFIKNGYESMKALQAIRSKEELNEIGVRVLGHRALIYAEIERLRSMDLSARYGANNQYQQQQFGQMQQQQQQMQMQMQMQQMQMHNVNGEGGAQPGGGSGW